MIQIMIISKDQTHAASYAEGLALEFDAQLITQTEISDALELVKMLPDMALLLCFNPQAEPSLPDAIEAFFERELFHVPVLTLGGREPRVTGCRHLPGSPDRKVFIEEVRKLLGFVQGNFSRSEVEYRAVDTYCLYNSTTAPCDIFIKVKKDGTTHYVKRIHSLDTYDLEMVRRYEAQGLKSFFVPETDFVNFAVHFANSIVNELALETEIEKCIVKASQGYSLIKDYLMGEGLGPSMVEVSRASVGTMAKSISGDDEITLLQVLMSAQMDEIFRQCHLLAFICHKLLHRQPWYDKEVLKNICLAAFFSDITLRSLVQSKVASMEQLKILALTDEEKLRVIFHAKEAADCLKGHPDVNEQVLTILLQSHGNVDGIGFNDDPPDNLHPLSKVFLISDHFVKILLGPEDASIKADILPLLAAKFRRPSYQKIIKAMERRL